MPFNLKYFAVEGLYGDTSIRIPINDNRLVIVGVNGLGKSTYLNIFYYFISRQWHRLGDYDFSRLIAHINDEEFVLSKEDLFSSIDPDSVPLNMTPDVIQALSDPNFATKLMESLRLPGIQAQQHLRRAGYFLTRADISTARNYITHFKHTGISPSPSVGRIRQFLEENLQAKILFLPTYRRIEKDLNIVLPGLQESLDEYRVRGRHYSRDSSDTSFLELVEFGMDDVRETINRTLAQQKETARSELNSLAGSYLRDVLRGQGEEYDHALLSSLTPEQIEDILTRVEEKTLSEFDKVTLLQVMTSIRQGQSLKSSDKYVAHFFVKLVQARQKLQQAQIPITRFVDVCNGYFDDKVLAYDDVNYTLSVVRNEKHIELSSLSSGEKQIVSLFSQIYLGSVSYLILIDEPELSLSVNWQKKLLPDLNASHHCIFIAAVTHSPFIFDNEFEPYTVDMSQFVFAG